MSGNRLLALTSVLFLPLFACRDARTPGEEGTSTIEGGSAMSLAVTTTAFSQGGVIPKGYTCDGADTSPTTRSAYRRTGSSGIFRRKARDCRKACRKTRRSVTALAKAGMTSGASATAGRVRSEEHTSELQAR